MSGRTQLAAMRTTRTPATTSSRWSGERALSVVESATPSTARPPHTVSATTPWARRGSFMLAHPLLSRQPHDPPFQADPFHADPFHAEPFHAEPFQAEPFQADPFQAEPFQADPFQADPFHAEPFHADPFQPSP